MRNQLVEFLKKELIGPDPVPPHVQQNGEEILINEPPRLRYSAGILFPQGAKMEDREKTDKEEQETLEMQQLEGEEPESSTYDSDDSSDSGIDPDDAVDSTEEIINLANAYLPSAMGFSCFLNVPEDGFIVKVQAGTYSAGDYAYENNKGEVKPLRAYYRQPLARETIVPSKQLPTLQARFLEIPIVTEQANEDKGEPRLVLNIHNRTSSSKFGIKNQLYTFSLINKIKSGKTIRNEDCYFQVEFSLRATDYSSCFLPYPERQSRSKDDDDTSKRLLYRHRKNYAVGHGCAIDWIEKQNKVIEVRSSTTPTYEIKPIVPKNLPDVVLSMYEMSDFGNEEIALSNLKLLCEKYNSWINEQEWLASKLADPLKEIAESHIDYCRKCHTRMRDGIKFMYENLDVKRAFKLMNRAMLMQQVHYNIPLREWYFDKKAKSFKIPDAILPDIHVPSTWPDWDEQNKRNKKLGKWYPFQIAFILMNLKSMALPEEPERKIVDLIWFPTGGGKTEAYLGYTAYTIFLKRICDKNDDGTAVLMRYTLRLLTAQQYQRASALIAACDLIRKDNENLLGTNRITIGLWAGLGLTPNRRAEAVRILKSLSGGQSYENPFIILKCPWCGAQMGQIREKGQTRVKGYYQIRRPSTVIHRCDNSNCIFSSKDYPLPLNVIDEDIYEAPPTMIIGTVDKFAILPWKPEARSIFGFREKGERKTPPELIIQDELHLISGPLGSMVGHYETLISELCNNPVTKIGAKIIASTATISRAKEQCHALYNCGKENIFQFPPQSLEAGDSFFAFEDEEAPGRMYAGVYAAAGISHAMAQIRVISALLQGVKSIAVEDNTKRDFYWTILNYFNSLRELGHAATLINADIREYLNAMWIRKGIRKSGDSDPRRFINRHIELTSRIPSTQIPYSLQALEINYPYDENLPVDICLATNMISVGVDVQRLGLMTVIGQPKTTSEYIQATSRVGRSNQGPGLVVVIFNTQKPRDRSHYEHFRSYHSRIYSQVEPTSVTPFSAPIRDRALHAILIGLIRYFFPKHQNFSQPVPDKKVIEKIFEIFRYRVSGIDPDEEELTIRLLMEKIDDWTRLAPSKYGDFIYNDTEAPLIYPAGTKPQEDWENRSWATPTSMRNVDADCEANVIVDYLTSEEENDER